MEELRRWLHTVEIQLAAPVILETCTEAGLDKCLVHQDVSLSITNISLLLIFC